MTKEVIYRSKALIETSTSYQAAFKNPTKCGILSTMVTEFKINRVQKTRIFKIKINVTLALLVKIKLHGL